eukprot:TRINITY_DN11259_c0_g1_i1.p1 TRINITY_DN11259_c0_g1~~TRINITY_DN11259_c0_g1_i1.p1  ORF type:complete len:489 (-),score=124.54 TRINITY_DN11259_c0_g1_i1:106-1536(-)
MELPKPTACTLLEHNAVLVQGGESHPLQNKAFPFQFQSFKAPEQGSVRQIDRMKTDGTFDIVSLLEDTFAKYVSGPISGALDYFSTPLTKQQCNLNSGEIVDFAVHPNEPRIAVIRKIDSSVHFYDMLLKKYHPLCLNHDEQIEARKIAFKPKVFNSNIVAIGCKDCVMIWTVSSDARKMFGEVSKGKDGSPWRQVLPFDGTVVDQLCWSPDGNHLAAASSDRKNIRIFNLITKKRADLKRHSGGNVTNIQWCPSGEFLFVGTSNNCCFIYETQEWKSEKWTFASPIQAAVWSPSGRSLLLAEAGSPRLSMLTMKRSPPAVDAELSDFMLDASRLPHCKKYLSKYGEGDPLCIRSLALDGAGERLIMGFARKSRFDIPIETETPMEITGEEIPIIIPTEEKDTEHFDEEKLQAVFLPGWQPAGMTLLGYCQSADHHLPVKTELYHSFSWGVVNVTSHEDGTMTLMPHFYASSAAVL